MPARKKRMLRNGSGSSRRQPDLATTRDRLIEAAKQHFLEFGLQHASVRAITELAGVNSALVGYHFGSKKALYEEVVHLTAKRLIEVRIETLERLRFRHSEQPIPVRDLLRAYSEPLLGSPDESLTKDAAIYLRFFGRMYTEPSDELRGILQSQFTALQTQYIDEIVRSVPYVPREEIVYRFGLLIGALTFLGSKTGIIEILSKGQIDAADSAYVVSRLVTAYAALFTAPPTSADSRNEVAPRAAVPL